MKVAQEITNDSPFNEVKINFNSDIFDFINRIVAPVR